MTPSDVEAVHEASLRILDEVGVRLEHDEVVARVLSEGARRGSGPQDVRLPREMVLERIALAPSAVGLAARDGTVTRLTPTSEPVFWTCPVLYFYTGAARREVTSQDLRAIARLGDHVPNLQAVMGVAMADVRPERRDFVGLRYIAESGRKHARALCFTPRGMEAMVRMKPVFPGAWFSVGFTAHGPLRWTHLALDIFLKGAGHRIPATINGEPMAGVTAPVTPAGAIAVGNAEILAGIVVNQILEPGRPIIYNLGLGHVFDMRYATVVTGGPESAFFADASAALGRFYNLPSASWVSTDSVHEDEQAAAEKMFGFATHSAAGVGLIWGLGQLESQMTLSLAQLVIDDELVSYLRRFRRGFEVSGEELALELIRETGIGGSYLESDHTLTRHRDALFRTTLLNRRVRANADAPLPEVARRRALAILEQDVEPKIGEVESAELRRIEEHFQRAE
jgi:trimethylamine---corrinoid protein Co-methyltransferase